MNKITIPIDGEKFATIIVTCLALIMIGMFVGLGVWMFFKTDLVMAILLNIIIQPVSLLFVWMIFLLNDKEDSFRNLNPFKFKS